MVERIDQIDNQIPIYFVHGERSWIDTEPYFIVKSKCKDVYIDTIKDAGHHVKIFFFPINLIHNFYSFQVYADAPVEFDMYLKRVLINKE
jgi:hypothetical protein